METKTIAGYVIILALSVIFLILLEGAYKSKRPALWFSLLFGIPIFFSLTFHTIQSRLKVFPKDNFTFSNTIITEKNIKEVIDRYNNATFFEKNAIRNEALIKKLIQQGIIGPTISY